LPGGPSTPFPQKLKNAREEEKRLATLEVSVKNVQLAMDDGKYCPYGAEIKTNTDHRKSINALGLVVVAGLIGTFVSIGVSCEQQTTRDTETRVLVQQNTKSVAKLERAINTINDARAEDADRIIAAVRQNGHRITARVQPEWCDTLSKSKIQRIRRLVGEDPCRD
jgi:hypothetical protein